MQNIALTLAYLGTNYHGFQRQPDQQTIQGTLENAASSLFGTPITVYGCGRTDAGVHAKIYCANFHVETSIPIERIPFALNTHLPPDIVVQRAQIVPTDFHAITSCIKKEYTYQIFNRPIPDPFFQTTSYHYGASLDVAAMTHAAKAFVGTHDFAAMKSEGSSTKTTVRTVFAYEIEQKGNLISLRAAADGFLYNMARTMAGTLLYVGIRKIQPDAIPQLLQNADRTQAGPTLPPQGLAMTGILYPNPFTHENNTQRPILS